MSPQLQTFLNTVAKMAGQLQGVPVLLVFRDPATRVVGFVGTPGALDNMRPEIINKVRGNDPDESEATAAWEAG